MRRSFVWEGFGCGAVAGACVVGAAVLDGWLAVALIVAAAAATALAWGESRKEAL